MDHIYTTIKDMKTISVMSSNAFPLNRHGGTKTKTPIAHSMPLIWKRNRFYSIAHISEYTATTFVAKQDIGQHCRYN